MIFSQRYRNNSSIDKLQNYQQGSNVELLTPLLIFDALNKTNNRLKQFIFISSAAGIRTYLDINADYHIFKASNITLSKYISSKSTNIRSNTIILGEFLKYPINEYKPAEI